MSALAIEYKGPRNSLLGTLEIFNFISLLSFVMDVKLNCLSGFCLEIFTIILKFYHIQRQTIKLYFNSMEYKFSASQ